MVTLTKEWLAAKVAAQPARAIGRALLAIYNKQTDSEQHSTATKHSNGRGFSKPDARVGSIGARQYAAHQTLDEWVVSIWAKPAADGYPRICRYIGQLSAIASRTHTECIHCAGTGIDLLYDEPRVCIECDGNGFVLLTKYEYTPATCPGHIYSRRILVNQRKRKCEHCGAPEIHVPVNAVTV